MRGGEVFDNRSLTLICRVARVHERTRIECESPRQAPQSRSLFRMRRRPSRLRIVSVAQRARRLAESRNYTIDDPVEKFHPKILFR